MRFARRFAASGALSASLAGSAVLALVVIAAASPDPALAATSGQPGEASGFATPSTVTPGTAVTFDATCASTQAASATLFGATLGLAAQIPMNAETGGSGVFIVVVTLPSTIQPGTYNPAIDCSDGSSTTASLKVTAVPSSDGVATGDGTTSTATNTGLSAVGLALIAVGAVTGGIALRRRSSTRS